MNKCAHGLPRTMFWQGKLEFSAPSGQEGWKNVGGLAHTDAETMWDFYQQILSAETEKWVSQNPGSQVIALTGFWATPNQL